MIETALFLAFGGFFFWGISDFVSKDASIKSGIYIANLISNIVGFVVLFFVCIFLNIQPYFDPYLLLFTFITSLLFVAGGLLYFHAVKIGGVSVVSPICSSYSIFVVIGALLFLGETLSMMQIILISVVIMGVFLVSADFSKITGSKIRKGALFAVLVSIFWAAGVIIGTCMIKEYVHPFSYPMTECFFGIAIMVVIMALKKERFFTPKISTSFSSIFAGLTNIVGVLFTWFGYFIGMVSIVNPIASAYPAMSVILAHKFYKEKMIPNQILGIIFIIVAMIGLSL